MSSPKRLSKSERASRAADLERRLRDTLARARDDAALRTEMEALASERLFRAYTWLWGPALYRRSRVVFRSFIVRHFATFAVYDDFHWEPVRWEGHVGRELESWLADVDRDDDVALFRALYQWRYDRDKNRNERWRKDLLRSYGEASTSAARQTVLRKYDLWFRLDEPAALALYRKDAPAAREFILRHLAGGFFGGETRSLWEQLLAAAREVGDDAFHDRLYRRQVPLARWRADVLALAQSVASAQDLCAALEARHPEGWGLDMGTALHDLVAARGEDVFPYLRRHLRDVWSHWYRSGFDRMVELAASRGWWELWGALVRTCSRPKEFNATVERLVGDRSTPEQDVRHRLLLLAGVAREWNLPGLGLARVQGLDEPVAVALYERFPDLVRGALRLNVAPGWNTGQRLLLERAIGAGDEAVIDFLASRLVTRSAQHGGSKLVEAAQIAAHYYESLRLDEVAFARRAAAVLTQVPAYSIWRYAPLTRTNRLARLLFERSTRAYLADAAAIQDLVEGSEIHVQALAYRALGLDDDRARTLAAANIDLLLGTLLRPLQRATRMLALGALANAATTEPAARRVLARARDALELPDERYPKDALVGLIGTILARHPGLRGPGEEPQVFRSRRAA
jgi:hypothetical protein